MKNEIVTYPIIVTECNDEYGHYFGATSPNIKGMVTDGKDLPELIEHAKDALATALSDDMDNFPEVQDPRNWKLEKNESIMWISVNMKRWGIDFGKSVRKNITIPTLLSDWAKENKINISQITTNALKEMYFEK